MKTLLVVDDEAGIVESLKEVLSDEGFAVIIARNGKDALHKISTQQPDLVLLDYMMPIMDGGEALKVVQSTASTATLPVIMMSAVPRSSLPDGVRPSAFLRKPFDIDVLIKTIHELLTDASEPL